MFVIYIFFFIIVLAILDFICYSIYFRVKYAQSPLDIKTFDGSNQPYHPSVLFFEDGWNEHNYWMVETPYPINGKPYRDRWECPMIHFSDDGINWNQICNSPIDDLTEAEIENRDFFSDPHLVFVNNRIECFYRLSHRSPDCFHTSLLRKVSIDGKKWGKREIIADFDDPLSSSTLGDMVRSQALIFQDERYKMWYVDGKDPKGYKQICYSESIDGTFWEKKQICKLLGREITPWHIDVNFIHGQYILTVYDLHDLSLWQGQTTTDFEYLTTVLSPSRIHGSFYSDGLYRACLICDTSGLKMYFSSYDDKKTSIGLLLGSSFNNMHIYSSRRVRIGTKNFVVSFFMNHKILFWNIKENIKSLCYGKKRVK